MVLFPFATPAFAQMLYVDGFPVLRLLRELRRPEPRGQRAIPRLRFGRRSQHGVDAPFAPLNDLTGHRPSHGCLG